MAAWKPEELIITSPPIRPYIPTASTSLQAGALDGLEVEAELLSYEGVTCVGYGMAVFAVTGPNENRRLGKHSFTSARVRRLGGNLETTKRSISLAAEECHVEGDHAVGLWRKRRCRGGPRLGPVNRNILLHLSRFFPQYRVKDRPPTPEERIYRADGQNGRYPAFVYTGNCGLGFDYFLSRRAGDHFGNITARELGSSKL